MSGEFDIIQRYFAPLSAAAPGAFGLGDDAAVLAPRQGYEIVVTTDTIVAGVHYLEDAAPEHVVAKLIGSNLSDLAAMGAKPVCFTLNCAWTKGTSEQDISAFADALKAWVDDYSFPLLGGDTVAQEGQAVFTVTAFGEVRKGKALRRCGAKPGDGVYVTGTIGDGALGLKAAAGELKLDDAAKAFLIDRYRTPQPRIDVGLTLAGRASACIDISDGLVQDAGHIADQSGTDIVIEIVKLPLSDAARAAVTNDPALMSVVLGGGDDYELLFTSRNPIPGATRIGTVGEGEGTVTILKADGQPHSLSEIGYKHF